MRIESSANCGYLAADLESLVCPLKLLPPSQHDTTLACTAVVAECPVRASSRRSTLRRLNATLLHTLRLNLTQRREVVLSSSSGVATGHVPISLGLSCAPRGGRIVSEPLT